jgi:hypothetical protein
VTAMAIPPPWEMFTIIDSTERWVGACSANAEPAWGCWGDLRGSTRPRRPSTRRHRFAAAARLGRKIFPPV